MKLKFKLHSYYCYAIILRDNLLRSEFYPAFIVCWDNRAHNDEQVFILKRRTNIINPVVTTVCDDVYELKKLYERFRFSIRDEKGEPRKTYIHGILVICRCNETASRIKGPYLYVSNVNNEESKDLNQNENMKRWQETYLEKEKQSYNFDLADIVCSEEGIMLSQENNLPGIYGG